VLQNTGLLDDMARVAAAAGDDGQATAGLPWICCFFLITQRSMYSSTAPATAPSLEALQRGDPMSVSSHHMFCVGVGVVGVVGVGVGVGVYVLGLPDPCCSRRDGGGDETDACAWCGHLSGRRW
jgi:hypothetical protein